MSNDLFEQLVHDYSKSRNLFIVTASELFYSKYNLRELLPSMLNETEDTGLKELIYETLTNLDIQMLRIKTMMLLLHAEVLEQPKGAFSRLNQHDYLICNGSDENDFHKDWVLINQLLLIEAMEYQAFNILFLVTQKLEDKQLCLLIMQTLRESKQSTKTLQQALRDRLT
ncbi:DUF892 family protein [Mucilaginibacter robiniae]|uniref:DUF892 family protein n=1 Tax=Mucilaginibacter robiniae TaxID=2728022 RepID=A0A7L5E316_9SPHI|nr:DUF892 family protein [Mucilaginibacter robiniae]QJD96817.1 DUF892 family protein [Mucilaginibacter robiniae]